MIVVIVGKVAEVLFESNQNDPGQWPVASDQSAFL